MKTDRAHAQALDAADPLAAWHDRFVLPRNALDGSEVVYLCGHSLGAQPVLATEYVEEVMRDWRSLGVEGHFDARHPWMSYHERLTHPLAEIVGAAATEVIAMNSLTANLHFMLVSFYRPTGERPALLLERHAFPSDRYAVESQVLYHGRDPARDLLELAPRPGEDLLRTDDVLERIERDGARIATILLPGVQYLTGQALDIGAITRAGRAAGCVVGWDLAHAVGNIPLQMHDSAADFAVWCHYKYLNGGPGAVGGAFVHARHQTNTTLPRFAGWWGHDKGTRFRMGPEFQPIPGAEGWQLSNPPILAMAPVVASLQHFAAVGMPALRRKSVALTDYFAQLVHLLLADRVQVVTPPESAARGAALSLRLLGLPRDRARHVFERLRHRGILPDWREPDVIRAAPVPFYNRYEDVWRFVDALRAELNDVSSH